MKPLPCLRLDILTFLGDLMAEMSKRKDDSGIDEAIDALIAGAGHVTSGQVAREAKVSRQAAHYHLRRLADAGRLRRIGAGRGSRYVLAVDFHRAYSLEGLREDAAWGEVRQEVKSVAEAPPIAAKALRFAFTEMVNNAIEHSGGTTVEVDVASAPRFFFRVADDGVGVFRHFGSRFGLEDVAAAFELTKGKRTTDPEHHSGQGIFFTSRIVDRFGLEANGIRLTVDNDLHDFALGESGVHEGTTVWWEVDPQTTRDPARVYTEYTDEETLEFTRTRIPLRTLGGSSFISRAEAERVADGLERFEEVILDFTGVTDVGQAFADELFRVWASEHPGTRLVPVSTSPVIDKLLRSVTGDGSTSA
jgi:anti-sigma regulatory factor (Ser/Thr protein kinase)